MILPISKYQSYRILIGLLFTALLMQASITFYNFLSSPTDENIFTDTPSQFMVVQNFRGEMIERRNAVGRQPRFSNFMRDSVIVGDLILTINNGTPKTMKDANDMIYQSPLNEIRIDVLRPSINSIITFKVLRNDLRNEFLILLPNYVFVTDVYDGGVSDRGGMKIGDKILRINAQEFKSAAEADRILRLGQIGKSLKYEILRNNQFIELNIVLAKFSIPISILLFALSGTVWMMIGMFIAFTRPKLMAARLVGLSLLFIGFFITMLVIRRDFLVNTDVLIRQIMIGASYIFGTALYFHGMHYFPTERPEMIEKKWITRGYYIFSGISILLNIITNSPIGLAVIVIYGFGVLVKYRKSSSVEYKGFNKIIKWTGGIIFAINILTFALLRNNFQTYGLGIIGITLTLIPLSYLYTIGRYRLLDMTFRVRRNIQYSIATFFWGAVVFYGLVWSFFQLPTLDLPDTNIVFTGTAIEVNDAPEFADQRGASERIMLMTLAVILIYTTLRMRKYGQQFIDKKYYRQQYDYRKASNELGEVLATTLSADDLARGLMQKLSELMTLKRAGVLFFRDEQCCSCLSAYGFDGKQWKEFCLSHELELINSIDQFLNEFRIDYFPEHIKDEFLREGFHYGIPIRSKEKLIGVILVGEKQSETTFSQEDLAFLLTTAKQASVAIENSFLYEELAEKERMKHELDIARRIQLDSLPQSTPQMKGLEISGTSIPAMEVGGDFFDYLTNGNGKLTVVVGDVSGKGTSAALYMSKVQGILRSLHGFNLSPKDLFRRANTLLCKDLEKRSFVTVLGAEFDNSTKSLVVSRAGHLPLWHYDAATGLVKKILPRGLGLGLNDASIFTSEMEERTMKFASGDIYLFATDGITEAHSQSVDYGEERLHDLLLQHSTRSAEFIQQEIFSSVKQFAGSNQQHDDQTVVVVKIQ